MTNQLFKINPGLNILMELLKLFNITKLNKDIISFDKNILNLNNIPYNLNLIKEKFKPYYLENKYDLYFKNINNNRCITILRQILKINNYKLKIKNNICYIQKINKKFIILTFD
jgi:hypothetical protein